MGDALLSYASGACAAPLLGETIGENLERTAARYPGREALVDVAAGRRWTYAELDVAVNEVALGLLAMGIAKGERVGIWAPNCAIRTSVTMICARQAIRRSWFTISPLTRLRHSATW